jgi:hypothetical protein
MFYKDNLTIFPLLFLLLFLKFEFPYGKKQDLGSGINIPDPLHYYNPSTNDGVQRKNRRLLSSRTLVFVPYVSGTVPHYPGGERRLQEGKNKANVAGGGWRGTWN